MLRGDSVYLVPLDKANMAVVLGWLNDPAVNRWMLTGHIPLTLAEEEAYYEASWRHAAERSAFQYEIHLAAGDAYIGNCGLEHVDLQHRHGEIGIMIGDRDQWGKGYAGDAIRTLLRFGFETLGLHSVRICCYPENTRAYELYKRLGFMETGRDREASFLNGAFRDMVRLDMLEDEFVERYGRSAG